MNRYVQSLVAHLRKDSNVNMVTGVIKDHFKNPKVDSYIRDNFPGSFHRFCNKIERELMDSEPLPGSNFTDELAVVNQRLVDEQVKIIRDFIAPVPVARFEINDGRPTTRLGTGKSADEMLKDWQYARRQPQFRDDKNSVGTVHHDLGGTEVTGVTFCDQSDVGLQNHIDMYENTSTKLALNKYLPHEAVPFGVSTPESDARLLSRRIFRSEGGVENGIPARQRWLHNRHTDRELDESFYQETGHQVRGFDMAPTYARVGQIQRDRRSYPHETVRQDVPVGDRYQRRW